MEVKAVSRLEGMPGGCRRGFGVLAVQLFSGCLAQDQSAKIALLKGHDVY
jgi:hypothetical protein